MLAIVRHATARSFLERAEDWLLEREMENAIALTSARQARQDDSHYQKPVYWATIEDDGQIIGYAYRTPPYLLGINALPNAAITMLAAEVGGVYTHLTGVSGPEAAASSFAAAWTRPRRLSTIVAVNQRLYALGSPATPSHRPAGGLRLATQDDAAIVRGWGTAFLAETGLTQVNAKIFGQLIQARQLYVWDDGQPRCLVATIRQITRGAAVGVLYTPGESRHHGYAKSTLLALAQTLRERGLPECYLYADPTNAGADAVARSVGFEPVQDFVDIEFR